MTPTDNWHPNDGPYIVFQSIAESFVALKYEPQRVVIIGEEGVSAALPVNWLMAPQGAGIPMAIGMAVANPALKLVVLQRGQPDMLPESVIRQAARENHNITVARLNYDNEQDGVENYLALGATFVARGFIGDDEQLRQLMTAALRHNGLAFVSIISPEGGAAGQTFADWRQRQFRLQDPSQPAASHWKADDRQQARELAVRVSRRMDTGLFFKTVKPSYQTMMLRKQPVPLVDQPIKRLNIRSFLQKLT
jgi:2-oxoglutarate ferredoxin oxidoreductase subunit beta